LPKIIRKICTAIDAMVEKLERQITKHKEKTGSHR